MATTHTPFLSLMAHGSLHGITAQQEMDHTMLRRARQPPDDPTPAQTSHRLKLPVILNAYAAVNKLTYPPSTAYARAAKYLTPAPTGRLAFIRQGYHAYDIETIPHLVLRAVPVAGKRIGFYMYRLDTAVAHGNNRMVRVYVHAGDPTGLYHRSTTYFAGIGVRTLTLSEFSPGTIVYCYFRDGDTIISPVFKITLLA